MTCIITPAPLDSAILPIRSNAIGCGWQICSYVAWNNNYGTGLLPLQHLVLTFTAEAVLVLTVAVWGPKLMHLGCSLHVLALCLRLLGCWTVRCPCRLSLGYWLSPQPRRSPVPLRSSDADDDDDDDDGDDNDDDDDDDDDDDNDVGPSLL